MPAPIKKWNTIFVGLSLSLVPASAQEPIVQYNICSGNSPSVAAHITDATWYLNKNADYIVSGCSVSADGWYSDENYYYFSFTVEPGYLIELRAFEFEGLTGVGSPAYYHVQVASTHADWQPAGEQWIPIQGYGSGEFTQISYSYSGVYLEGRIKFRIFGTDGSSSDADVWLHRNMRVYGSIMEFPFPPSCADPTYPVEGASFINPAAQLQFRWSNSFGAAAYDFYLGTDNPPTNLRNGILIEGDVAFNSPRLRYNTTYYWQVVPRNPVGRASNCPVWTFTTQPYPINIRCIYNQTFDSFPLGVTSGPIAEHWENKDGDDGDWAVHSGPTPSIETGPMSDHTTGGGRYVFLNSSLGGNPGSSDTAILDSPVINISWYANPVASFWYCMRGKSMGSLHVDVFTGEEVITDAIVLSGNNGDRWRRAAVLLPASGDVACVRFRGLTSGDNSDIAIDDFRIWDVVYDMSKIQIAEISNVSQSVTLYLTNLEPQHGYVIERSASLQPDEWVTAGAFSASGHTMSWSEAPSETQAQNFYRVRRP